MLMNCLQDLILHLLNLKISLQRSFLKTQADTFMSEELPLGYWILAWANHE